MDVVVRTESGYSAAIDAASSHLDRKGFFILKLGEKSKNYLQASEAATRFLRDLLVLLKSKGLPTETRLDIEPPKKVVVFPGNTTRSLAPHQDSGRSSYLTIPKNSTTMPSFMDWSGRFTKPHKLYQGSLIVNPGSSKSGTTYYQTIPLLRRAYSFTNNSTRPKIDLVMHWLTESTTWFENHRPTRPNSYFSLANTLGLREPFYSKVTPHYLEASIDSIVYEKYSEYASLFSNCCGICKTAHERLLCNIFKATLGLDRIEVKKQFEYLAIGDTNDLVFGHNLFCFHGATPAPKERCLEAFGYVLDPPIPASYESWLTRQWYRDAPDTIDEQIDA